MVRSNYVIVPVDFASAPRARIVFETGRVEIAFNYYKEQKKLY